MKPLLTARDGRYYSTAWLVDGYQDRDWMAVLWRDGDGVFCASFRLRLLQEGRQEDECFSFPGLTEAQAIAQVNAVAAQVVSQDLGTYIAKMPVRTTRAKALQAAFDLRLTQWTGYYGKA